MGYDPEVQKKVLNDVKTLACIQCEDAGTRQVYCPYPWGGGDWVFEFCNCPAGKEEEKVAYEIYIGDWPNPSGVS